MGKRKGYEGLDKKGPQPKERIIKTDRGNLARDPPDRFLFLQNTFLILCTIVDFIRKYSVNVKAFKNTLYTTFCKALLFAVYTRKQKPARTYTYTKFYRNILLLL